VKSQTRGGELQGFLTRPIPPAIGGCPLALCSTTLEESPETIRHVTQTCVSGGAGCWELRHRPWMIAGGGGPGPPLVVTAVRCGRGSSDTAGRRYQQPRQPFRARPKSNDRHHMGPTHGSTSSGGRDFGGEGSGLAAGDGEALGGARRVGGLVAEDEERRVEKNRRGAGVVLSDERVRPRPKLRQASRFSTRLFRRQVGGGRYDSRDSREGARMGGDWHRRPRPRDSLQGWRVDGRTRIRPADRPGRLDRQQEKKKDQGLLYDQAPPHQPG